MKTKETSGTLMKWLTISRWWSLYTGVSAVTIGSVLALPHFNLYLYIAMLLAIISINAFANFVNDIYDFKHGEGTHAGVRIRYPNPLLNKSTSIKALWTASAVALAVAAVSGLYIYLKTGPIIVVLGLIGIALAYLYSAGKHSAKSMALGELAVFLAYGPLITNGAYLVEAQGTSLMAALTSIIVGIAIMLILFANNIRDIKADRTMGVFTLAGKLGQKRSVTLFHWFTILMYALSLILVSLSILPFFVLLVLVSAPYALKVNKIMARHVPDNSAELASRMALLFSITFSIGVILPYVILPFV